MGDVPIVADEVNPSFVFEAKNMMTTSFQKLQELLENELLCDVEIRTGYKSIKCHRVVLASCSTYFRAMFTSNLAESHQRVVTIGDIEDFVMEMLIRFAYTAKIEISVENVQAILHASSVLQLDVLSQACCNFMRLHLGASNCLSVRLFAERHGHMNLVSAADDYTRRNFLRVIKKDEFLQISASHFQDLISSVNICVHTEAEVYEAVMQWIKHDIESRRDLLPGFLAHVRLPLLPPSYLKKNVENEDLIRRNLDCRDLLDEARDYQLWRVNLLPQLPTFLNDRIRPRKSCSGVLFCVGGREASEEPLASVECYSPVHNRWIRVRNMLTKRRHVGCTVAQGKIYAIGGCNEKEHLAHAEVFDKGTNQWSLLSPMAVPRRGLGVCHMGGPIYSVGGLNDSAFFTTVERYNIGTNTWSSISPMNTPRGGVAVVVLKGCMYALGGNNGPMSLSTCERYDPHLDKWFNIASMNRSRAGAGAASLDGVIYVIGGFDNSISLASAERYDPDNDKWTYVCSMHVPRGGVGVATLGGCIYAVGGHNGSCYLKTVEVYDPFVNRWEYTSSILQCRAGAGVTWCPAPLEYMLRLERLQKDGTDDPKS